MSSLASFACDNSRCLKDAVQREFGSQDDLGNRPSTRELLVEGAERLIDVVSKGIVKNNVNQSYALKDTA